MKKILLIGLGGTIVCSFSKVGLKPKYSAKQLLEKMPKIKKMTKIDTIQLMTRTIVYPKDWIKLARKIAQLRSKYDGFVITMGTDTLAYTSAMLSFMLKNINKPVVITGAMFSIDSVNSDAKKNLTDSVLFACTHYYGVYVIFNGKVIKGCRASKTKCNSISAFESINTPNFAKIRNGKIFLKTKPKKTKNNFLLDTKININVINLKLNPQTSKNIFNQLSNYEGFIIEGYGDGNISDNLTPKIIEMLKKKKILVIASQCTYEKTEHKYQGGYLAIKHGAISGKDMTKEVIITKLMWCLGKSKNPEKVKKLMYKDICGEIYN